MVVRVPNSCKQIGSNPKSAGRDEKTQECQKHSVFVLAWAIICLGFMMRLHLVRVICHLSVTHASIHSDTIDH